MSFAYPWLLLLLSLVPLLMWWRKRQGTPPAFLYSSVELVRGITGVRQSSASVVLRRMRWLALILFILALARPQLGEGEAKITASGVDIVVALDRSTSMQTPDFKLDDKPVDRLSAAKDVLERFVRNRTSDRIGVVAFARHAYIAAPLTLDHDFLLSNLERLNFAQQGEDGTAIGSALSAALNRLRDLPSQSRIVILMTDGQNNAGRVPPLTAAEAARALGVKVYTIAVGGKNQAYVDALGRTRPLPPHLVVDEGTLQKIADLTGGHYYRADDTETLRTIYGEIDALEKTEVQVTRYQHYRDLYRWFLFPGVFVLLLEIILSHTVWRRLP